MAFGQQSGPPATAKQVNELLELLRAAGHSDFRDARGPMGFTQRQAGGKFSRDEADAFIAQLHAEAEGGGEGEAPAAPQSKIAPRPAARPATAATRPAARPAPRPAVRPIPKQFGGEPDLTDVSTEALAAELQRRGWIVVEP
jgi:hypothetical protein